MMKNGKFRDDLYYGLHVIAVNLPSLRECKEDVPLLEQHFLDEYIGENNRTDLEP